MTTKKQDLWYAKRLQKMIQCETISQTVHHDEAFARLRDVMKTLFPLLHEKATLTIFEEDCWLYELSGKTKENCMVLMSHHDVAPVTGEWQYPAFSGEIIQDRIWGRGTVDTKTSLFAICSAVEELLEEGFVFPCTIYLASSHNEEIAGKGIPAVVSYFEKHQIIPEFVLDEGGAVIDPPMAGIQKKCSVLAVHEKGRVQLHLCALTQQEHAGLSQNRDTPAMRMAKFMVQLEKQSPYQRKFSPELIAMFQALAPHMKVPMKTIFQHLTLFSPILKRIIPKLNVQAGAMLGTTGSIQELASTSNGCEAKLLLRPVSEVDVKEELHAIEALAKTYGIRVELQEQSLFQPAHMQGPAWEHVTTCMKDTFPETIVMPFILPAGTDARHFCNICPHVYRFAPIDIDQQQFQSVHGIDENLYIAAIPKAVGFYRNIICNYQIEEASES